MNTRRRYRNANVFLTLLSTAICCLFGGGSLAYASSVESPARIMQAANHFIQQTYSRRYEINVNFGYLDNRLRLAQCKQALEAFLPTGLQGPVATSVGVRCADPNWQVFIPVQIQAYTSVLTASQPLARGTILAAGDLKLRKREISQYLSGVFTDKNELIGMVLKHPLAEGSVFTPRVVRPKRLVRRGEPVTILAQAAGMTVRVQGQALMDGHHGEMIQVKNANSGKKLVAEVIAPSTVRIKM